MGREPNAAKSQLNKIRAEIFLVPVFVFGVTFLVCYLALREDSKSDLTRVQLAQIDSVVAKMSPRELDAMIRSTSGYTTRGGYPASTSKKMVEKVGEYVASGDWEAAEQFIRENHPAIFMLKAGLKVRIVEEDGWTGLIKIRAEGKTTELWTRPEAVQPGY